MHIVFSDTLNFLNIKCDLNNDLIYLKKITKAKSAINREECHIENIKQIKK